MKIWRLILPLLVIAVPALAQEPDDTAQNIGGQYALGNLALRDVIQVSDPIQQFKTFFEDVNLPLTKKQEQKLNEIVDGQKKELERLRSDASGEATNDAIRAINQEYGKLVNGALTPQQQSAWRHYRVEQLRLRGGLPALQSVLEQNDAPLTFEQEKSIKKIFANFEDRRARLLESSSKPETGDSDRLAIAEIDRILALLTPEQRQALQRSRRMTANARR